MRSVFFISDSTGITAETLGLALLAQFPTVDFDRHTVPFVETPADARTVVTRIDNTATTEPAPLVLLTVVDPAVRAEFAVCHGVVIDLLGTQIEQMSTILGVPPLLSAGQAHGQGDSTTYRKRMRAVEFAIEHDDAQSVRALELADAILIAPSRCGKTPTSMYMALQHGLFVANYPLVDEDFDRGELPPPIVRLVDRCFGLTSNPMRLSEIRRERQPGATTYNSLEQCRFELRGAAELYRKYSIPFVDTSTKSVEEISAVIMQKLHLSAGQHPVTSPAAS